jgi:hypothetical protein
MPIEINVGAQGEHNEGRGYQEHQDLEKNRALVKSVRSERFSTAIGSSCSGKDDLFFFWHYIDGVKYQNVINLNQSYTKLGEYLT